MTDPPVTVISPLYGRERLPIFGATEHSSAFRAGIHYKYTVYPHPIQGGGQGWDEMRMRRETERGMENGRESERKET